MSTRRNPALDVRPGIPGTYRTTFTDKGGRVRAYPAHGGAAWDNTLVRVADETTVESGRVYDTVKQAEHAGHASLRGKRGAVEVTRMTNPRSNPGEPFDALHAAAGPALRAWMDTHRDDVETVASDTATMLRAWQGGAEPTPTGDLTTTPAFRRWFGASKVVDAAGKPLRVYHGTTAGGFTEFQHGERSIGLNRLGFWFDAGTFLPSQAFAGGEEIPRWGGAGNVIPVYLSLKNPKEYASDPLTRDEYDTLDALTRAKANGTPGESVPEGEVERNIRRDAATLRVRPALPQDVRGRIENITTYLRRRGWRDAIEKMLADLLPETGGRVQVVDNAVADAARERLAKQHDGIILRSTLTDRSLLKTLRWEHPDAERIPLGRGGNVEHYGSDWFLALHPTQIKSATGNEGTFDPNDPDIRRNPRLFRGRY